MQWLKNKLYYYITHRLLDDPLVITILYSKLQQEKHRLDKIVQDARAAKIDSEQRRQASLRDGEKAKLQSLCIHLKGGRVLIKGSSRNRRGRN